MSLPPVIRQPYIAWQLASDFNNISPGFITSPASPQRMSAKDVEEPTDSRFSKASKPSIEKMGGLTPQPSDFIHHEGRQKQYDPEKYTAVESETEPIYVGLLNGRLTS